MTASAIGFYGYDRGDTPLDEDSSRGDGFLADVVADWEAAAAPASVAGRRTVAVRTATVQAARGGTLKLMRPLFAAGLGGPGLGNASSGCRGSASTTWSTCTTARSTTSA